MKDLYQIVRAHTRRHLYLLFLTLFSLIGVTVASQLEMLALGVITDTGTDFFTLFHDEKGEPDQVSWDVVDQKWDQIADTETGVISKERAEQYLKDHKKSNVVKQAMGLMKKWCNLNTKVHRFVIFLLIVACIKGTFLFFSRYFTSLVSVRISQDLRERYFNIIQKQPMSFFQKNDIGSLSSRVAVDASQIAASLNALMINYLQFPFIILSSLVGCIALSWRLSMLIFVCLPLILIPLLLVAKKVKKVNKKLQKNQERFSLILIDFLSGIQTIKIFGMELFAKRKYADQNAAMAKVEEKTAKYDLLTRPILHIIATLSVSSILIFGLYVLQMKLSELIVFIGLLNLFYEPIKKFAEENNYIQKGIVSAERMKKISISPSQQREESASTELMNFREQIVFDRVWFKYEDKWILKDLSFTVNKGETVAIIGATGSGKSTILKLFPRLYEVEKGAIYIDGVPIQKYTKKSLREQISFIPQNPFLFADTVLSNISYGKPFSFDAVQCAAKKAYAHEFIEELPQKYDTVLSEKGSNLSGGQQQRLAIARALVKKAPILILDEATSALDVGSERQIQRSIEDLHGEVTQIIVAHRLSTIEHVDKIIYVESGKKIGEGTKEELLTTCAPFRELWSTYMDGLTSSLS